MIRCWIRQCWRDRRNDYRWSGVRLWVALYRAYRIEKRRAQRKRRIAAKVSAPHAYDQPFMPGALLSYQDTQSLAGLLQNQVQMSSNYNQCQNLQAANQLSNGALNLLLGHSFR